MSEHVLWSVIIPTAGRASSLRRTLRSLCRQTLDPRTYEILVVNNGQKDDASDAIAQEAIKRFPDHAVRLFHAAPPGLLSGRHLGAMEAKGPILTFVDDDIVAAEDYGEAILSAFARHSVALVGGPSLPSWAISPPEWLNAFWIRDEDGPVRCPWLSLISFGDKPKLYSPSHIYGLNLSIRRDTLFDLDGFHPDNVPQAYQVYQGDGETGLTKKAIQQGLSALYEPRAKVWHLVPSSRLTETYFRNRAFYQGVCDSFTQLRDAGAPVPTMPAPEQADPTSPNDMQKRVHNAYVDGWCFHQNAIRQSPRLLEWALRKNYWDYSYPELEKGLSFPRAWSDRILKNPLLALGDPARVLCLALAYGLTGRSVDAERLVTLVERAYPAAHDLIRKFRDFLLEVVSKERKSVI